MPRAAKREESGSASTTLSDPDQERLYWLGALPAIGDFEIRVPTLKKTAFYNRETDEYSELVKTNAYRLWFDHDPRMWRGKCPYYQNLTVKGWEFVAFTERMIDQLSTEKTAAMEPWPGQVAKFDAEKMKTLLATVKNHVMREEKGKGFSPQKYENVRILDLAEELPKDRDPNNPLDRPIMWKKPAWNVKLDTRLSELVYIVPLDGDVDMDPKDYHLHAPPMNEFLVSPPKSAAEMWVEKKEAVA